MSTGLLKFNRAKNPSYDASGLLSEFYSSGIEAIDSLWSRPSSTFQQRTLTAEKLFERAVGGNNKLRIAIRNVLNLIPMPRTVYRALNERRVFRGDDAEFADMIHALVVRFPFAYMHYGDGELSRARLVMQECLSRLVYVHHVRPLRYDKFLAHRMEDIIDVVTWYSNREGKTARDMVVAAPFLSYLWDRKAKGLEGSVRQKILGLYHHLDASLDVIDHNNGSWFTLHQLCREALGEPKSESRLFNLEKDVLLLIRNFKSRLGNKIGEDFAEALICSDYTAPWKLVKNLNPSQRAAAFLKLTEARKMYHGDVGLKDENIFEVLHKMLHAYASWRELYNVASWLNEQDFEATDEQLADMVNSLTTYGAVKSELTLERAFMKCANGGYPKTLSALRGFTVAGQATDPMNFQELSASVESKLREFRNSQ